MIPRAVYITQNLLLNAAAPLVSKLRGPGELGIDGDVARLRAALAWLGSCLSSAGFRAHDRTVLELGPGRTCELLAALLLSGARSGIGLDTHLRVAPDCASPGHLERLSDMLLTDAADFVHAVGAAPQDVALRRRQIEHEGTVLTFSEYDGVTIPLEARSVDLIFSRAVLEHVAAAAVEPLVAEMQRVLVPGGLIVHSIDLRDHMQIDKDVVVGNWLDALTYPEWLFRAMFSNRPVSINRLRADEWTALFAAYGFQTLSEKRERLALPEEFRRDRLASRWRSCDDDALRVWRLVIVATNGEKGSEAPAAP